MSLSLYGVPEGTKRVNDKRTGLVALPLRILTCYGAQVALQCCPILLAGGPNLSQLSTDLGDEF
jgi:hypothetical protein